MCLAIPSKVVQIEDMTATIDVNGARADISLLLMPEDVMIGDYVLVHAGFAIQKVSEEIAMEAHRIVQEMAALVEAEDAKYGDACYKPYRWGEGHSA